jgi:hypothetical protein
MYLLTCRYLPPAYKSRVPPLPLSRALRSRTGATLRSLSFMAKITQAPTTVCAEYIALSYFFYHVPAPVARNTINQSSIEQKDYALPFVKERELTEVVAFLAKTKDGSDHIPAVCIEQNPPGTSLNVILAINKSTYDDGDDTLQKLKRSFEEIFHVLHDSQYGWSLLFCV